MNTLRVSLVIPAYNEESHLKACLDAVAAQTVAPFEVIVVDNNSTDATAAVAASYPFVTVISEPCQGIVHARNAGFNAVSGDIIARVDADTHLSAGWTERVIAFFADNPDVSAITGTGRYYDFPWPRISRVMHVTIYYYLQRLLTGVQALWGSNMAIRRSAWQAAAPRCHEHLTIDEDIDLSIQLHRLGKRSVYVPSLWADVSLRRRQLSPAAIARYLATWPRNYWVNAMYVRAGLIWLLMATMVAVAALPASVGMVFNSRR